MNRVRQTISALLIGAFVSLGFTAQAQTTRRRPVYRNNDYQMQQLIRRIETGSERFRSSLNDALDQSRYDGTNREDNINYIVDDFDHVIGHLRERYDRRDLAKADVQAVISRASRIDTFMRNNQLNDRAQRDWAALKVDLNDLANRYNIAWNQEPQNYPAYPPSGTGTGSYDYNRGLTGTYRLNAALSENPRTQADAALRNLPYNERRRTYDEVVARLTPPDALAIERQGNNVSIASNRAPRIDFTADGLERNEQMPNGNSVRTRAAFYGDELTVSTSGGVRSNDFAVTFDPINNGRRLQVTRQITVDNMRDPVTVRSVYDRTSDVAQFDIYNGSQTYPIDNGRTTTTTASGDFVIPNGTTLIAILNNDLSTQTSKTGDSFTMTVREPAQYEGATIEGTLANVKRSGRITGRSEMTFNFNQIRLRNGQTYNFAGLVDSIRTANGETVKVDNEGTVQDSNQTTKTEQRAAIGTAVGAIIGAIAGGGKGAAIGAILGAGGGAGSVYVQGQNDLDLRSGTEVTIRASGPR